MQFSKIIGQAPLKARLIGNIRERRVPHAQFFLGPRGSGVLPLALAYATYLFCENPGEGDSCGHCRACQMMAKLAHPDFNAVFPIFFLDKKPRTSEYFLDEWRPAVLEEPYLDADLWREKLKGDNKQLQMGDGVAAEVLRKLSLKSYAGGWKVMLVWLPEMMNHTMANKILKILEEPEPGTAFLLAGHTNGQMLPTILSRTQLVKVPALDPGEVASAIAQQFPALDPSTARAIAARSEGDLLEAKAMARGGEEEFFIFFRDWLRACYAGNVAANATSADYFQKLGREEQKGLIRYALYLMRQCMLQWQDLPQLVVTIGEELDFVRKFSALLNLRNIEGIRRELELAHVHLERNANTRILFMDLSYRLTALLRGRPMAA